MCNSIELFIVLCMSTLALIIFSHIYAADEDRSAITLFMVIIFTFFDVIILFMLILVHVKRQQHISAEHDPLLINNNSITAV